MDPAGPVARDIVDLTIVLTVLGAGVFVLFVVLGVVALRRGAAEPDDAGPRGDEASGYLSTLRGTAARRLVIGGGVLLPTVIIAVVFGWTLETMNDLPAEGGADALVVEITGHQWWWDVRYPESGIVLTDELHIEVDRPIELHLTSADVIHSFWVPALGGKMDAFPDFVNTLVLEASEVGVLRGRCAEFCGLHHASMDITVVAHEPEDFDAWLVAQSEASVAGTGGRG
jgi:cytochrome c oxidase subunit 2